MKNLLATLLILTWLSTSVFAATTGPLNVNGNLTVQGSVTALNSGTNPGGKIPGEALEATPGTGDIESDGITLYHTNLSPDRGALQADHMLIPSGTYTLASQTGAQALFNVGTSSTGTLPVIANALYDFDCYMNLSSLSATSGSFGFNLAVPSGATYNYHWIASKVTGNAIGTPSMGAASGATTSLTVAGTGTSGIAHIWGTIRMSSTAGTTQPQVSMTTGSAAVVAANSYFKLRPEGSTTNNYIGNAV